MVVADGEEEQVARGRGVFPMAVCAVVAVLWLRFRDQVMAPGLYAEDGAVLFPRHWVWSGFDGLIEHGTRFFQGYVSLPSNLAAWASCRLPTPYIGSGFVVASLLAAAAGPILFASPWFRGWLRDDRVRAVTAVGLAATAYGNTMLSTTLMYGQWSFLSVALLMLVVPSDRVDNWWAGSFRAAIVAFFSWSNPGCVALAPVAIAVFVRGAWWRRMSWPLLLPHAVALASVGLYVTAGIDFGYRLEVMPGVFIDLPFDMWRGIVQCVPVVLGRGFVGLFAPEWAVGSWFVAACVGAGASTVLAWAGWRGRVRGAAAWGLVGLLVAAVACTAVAAAGRPGLLTGNSTTRFVVFARLAFLLASAICVDRIVRRSPLVAAVVLQCGLVGLIGWARADRYRPITLLEDEPAAVAEFLDGLAANEREAGRRAGVDGSLPRFVADPSGHVVLDFGIHVGAESKGL